MVWEGDLRWGGGGGVREKIFPCKNFSIGKGPSMKGVQDFLALFKKNNEKINVKFFYTESEEQH